MYLSLRHRHTARSPSAGTPPARSGACLYSLHHRPPCLIAGNILPAFGRHFLSCQHMCARPNLSRLLDSIEVSADSRCLLGQSARIPNTFKAFVYPRESFASLLALSACSPLSGTPCASPLPQVCRSALCCADNLLDVVLFSGVMFLFVYLLGSLGHPHQFLIRRDHSVDASAHSALVCKSHPLSTFLVPRPLRSSVFGRFSADGSCVLPSY